MYDCALHSRKNQLLIKAISVVLFLVVILPGFAITQTTSKSSLPEGGLQMHRMQAGMPNKDGWYDAKSTDGHFRVLLPIPFNDFTVHVKEKDGRDVVLYCIGSKSAEGYKFSVAEYPAQKKPDADLALKDFVSSFKKDKQKVSEERYFKFQTYPTVEFHISGEDTSAFARMMVVPDRTYTLIVEYPTSSRRNVAPLIQPFFESLKIDVPKPEIKEVPN